MRIFCNNKCLEGNAKQETELLIGEKNRKGLSFSKSWESPQKFYIYRATFRTLFMYKWTLVQVSFERVALDMVGASERCVIAE